VEADVLCSVAGLLDNPGGLARMLNPTRQILDWTSRACGRPEGLRYSDPAPSGCPALIA
jgi:hypothetical protein